ncbi:MAG: WS/DGAT domain-containing protein, partial [Jatrophihabitans sp.]|uniref:WS/DGAT domain-containing protein n=1 Tax=Jatrophihabitans sp. TaxID=1932789 RepID=UPI003F8154DD
TPIAPLAPIAPRTPFPTVRQVAAEALRLPSLVAGSGLHAARAVARRSLGRMVRATADPVDARRYRATTVELADVDAVAAAGAATRDGVLHAMVDRAWGHVLATRGMGPADGPTGIVVPGMVAGPERPARVLGARLDRVVPCRPVPDGARATVAGVAYDGRLSLGISCAPGFAPDAEQFTRALGAALHRFRRATGATGPSRHDTAPRDAPDRTTRRVDMSHLRT